MKVSSIHIDTRFKRFQNLKIDLGNDPKKIVALVGPNGSGKSSVFDAFLKLNSVYVGLGSNSVREDEYFGIRTLQGSMPKIEITFEDGTSFPNGQTGRLGRTWLSFRSPYRFNENLDLRQISAVPDISGNSEGASYTSDIDAKVEANYRRLLAKYRELLEINDLRPSEAKATLISDLNQSLNAVLEISIDSIGDVEGGRGSLYFKKSDVEEPFRFNVLSSGEKEVVDILLDLWLRKDAYNDTIFLIDEPELHINPSVQRALFVEIEKLIGDNCQLWVATHSLGTLQAIQNELKDKSQIIYFDPSHNFGSNTVTLTPMETTHSQWKQILSVPLAELTDLLCPKHIVYCEGRDLPSSQSVAVERGMDAKVYNSIFNEKYPDTLFISSGGNTELDQRSEIALAVLSKAISGIKVTVLKDRDVSSGGLTNLNARAEYLRLNPNNHRMLVRKELENYLYDKGVLEAYCVDQGRTLNEVKYHQVVADINSDNVKESWNVIKSACGITTSVNADKFKENLAPYVNQVPEVFDELEQIVFGDGKPS